MDEAAKVHQRERKREIRDEDAALDEEAYELEQEKMKEKKVEGGPKNHVASVRFEEEDLEALFDEFDADGGGTVDYEEVRTCICHKCSPLMAAGCCLPAAALVPCASACC